MSDPIVHASRYIADETIVKHMAEVIYNYGGDVIATEVIDQLAEYLDLKYNLDIELIGNGPEHVCDGEQYVSDCCGDRRGDDDVAICNNCGAVASFVCQLHGSE